MDENIKRILKDSYNNNTNLRDKNVIDLWKLEELKKVLSIIKDKKNTNLLDLGAGSGIYAKYFADNGLKVTCIDLSSNLIELCKKKGLNSHIMDFYNLTFEENCFDVVWSLNSLLHVPKNSIEQILVGVKKILKFNGLFYLGLYGGEDFQGIWHDDFYEPKRFFSFYTDESIKRLVEKYFEIVSFETIRVKNKQKNFQSIIAKKIS